MDHPRKHSGSKSVSQRVAESNARLVADGGKIITVRLPKEAVERLDKLRKRWDMPKSMSAILVHFIMREPIRYSSTSLPPGQEKRKAK